MPINVPDSTSVDTEKNDTSLFSRKPYLGTKYIESLTENDIDMKNQIKIKFYLPLLILPN